MCGSSPKASRLYTLEELMFQFECENRKNQNNNTTTISQLEGSQAKEIPSYLGEGLPFVLFRTQLIG